MPSPWAHILTAEEIAAYHQMTAKLDPSFAKAERLQYEAMTGKELRVAMQRAWLCNEACRYQLARSYLALAEGSTNRH